MLGTNFDMDGFDDAIWLPNRPFSADRPAETSATQDPDESPETPTDEPIPPRVQDPPPQPDSQGPYVVTVDEH